jgi:hypothetical protein
MPARKVRAGYVAHLAAGHQVIQRAQGFFNWVWYRQNRAGGKYQYGRFLSDAGYPRPIGSNGSVPMSRNR